MEISSIRSLVEKHTLSELREAEFAIIQEKSLKIRVEGKDQAERLSHVIAAVWILEEMASKELEFNQALCAYNKKVRDQVATSSVLG